MYLNFIECATPFEASSAVLVSLIQSGAACQFLGDKILILKIGTVVA